MLYKIDSPKFPHRIIFRWGNFALWVAEIIDKMPLVITKCTNIAKKTKTEASYMKNEASYMKNEASYMKNEASYMKNEASYIKNIASYMKNEDTLYLVIKNFAITIKFVYTII